MNTCSGGRRPAGEVAVMGTCFHVDVSGDEGGMDRKSVTSGVVGAVIAAAAAVGGYEGKAAGAHAGPSVSLTAGQSAQAGPDGVKRIGGGSAEEQGSDPAAAPG